MDALARHIEELRGRGEGAARGSPEGVLTQLLHASVARAVAEANLAAWRSEGARSRAAARAAALQALVAVQMDATDALARARAALRFAETAKDVCRAAVACFDVIHRMCMDASGVDLGATCTKAYALVADAAFAFDVSRLGVLHRRTELEQSRAEFDAGKRKSGHLLNTRKLRSLAVELEAGDKESSGEMERLDALDARLTVVQEVVTDKAKELGIDLGEAAARDAHTIKIERFVMETVEGLMESYAVIGRLEHTDRIRRLVDCLKELGVRAGERR